MKIQCIDEIYIYPKDFFCPISCYTGEKEITDNTRSIHYYSDSWSNPNKVHFAPASGQ
jgi:hypothetical protein